MAKQQIRRSREKSAGGKQSVTKYPERSRVKELENAGERRCGKVWCLTKSSEGENEGEAIFDEIMAKNFKGVRKHINPQIF